MLFSVLLSIALAVVVAAAVIVAGFLLDEEPVYVYAISGAIGGLTGIVNVLCPMIKEMPWIGIILLTVMIAVDVALAYWWHIGGSSLKELLPFIAVAILSLFVEEAAAETITLMAVGNKLLTVLILATPIATKIILIAFYVVDMLAFQAEMREEDKRNGVL